MPRHRPKKGKPYNEEDLAKAIEEVNKHILENTKFSKRAIANKYNINKDVLNKHLQGKATGVAGRPTAIPKGDEEELATTLKVMSKWGFGLLKEEIKDIIQEYVIQNNIKTPFKDNRPGDDWFIAFRTRHNLSVKKPEALEVTRRTITSDPFIIHEFYDLLSSEIKRLGLEKRPECIYNLDESGFNMDPSKTKVVTEKGKPAHRVIQGSGRENTTVLACVSASGKALPPLVIFEANKFWSTWVGDESKGMVKGTFFGVSPTGWMTLTVFHEWFMLFTQFVKERPILLLFDGHLSHLDIKTIEAARANNITILKFPPHTTDLLQPLDRGVFGPLKSAWDREIHVYQREHQQKLTKADFVNVLGRVWPTCLSEKNITAGFRKTGVYPVDCSKYPVDRFDPNTLNRFSEAHPDSPFVKGKAQKKTTENDENEQDQTTRTENLTINLGEVSEQERQSPCFAGPSACPSTSLAGTSACPSTCGVSMTCHLVGIPATPLACEVPTASHAVPATPKRSFEELLLQKVSPKVAKPQKKRRKVDTKAVVITSDIYTDEIKRQEDEKQKAFEEKEARRKARKEKKKSKMAQSDEKNTKKKATKGVTKKGKSYESSDDDSVKEDELTQEMSDGPLDLTSSSDDDNFLMVPKFKLPTSLRQILLHMQNVRDKIEVMQVYAVYFETTYYLGQVQKVFYSSEDETPENLTEVEIKYLKWCGDDKFKWPAVPEIELVKPVFIFHGPIKTESFDPFIVPSIDDIRCLYKNISKFKDEIFTENISTRVNKD